MKLDFYSIAGVEAHYYEGMVEATIEIDKDHTAEIICEEEVVDKVKALFQSKELSDEEIEKIAVTCSDMDYGSMHLDTIKFARAILKKASEK